jgi:hypothetical protein
MRAKQHPSFDVMEFLTKQTNAFWLDTDNWKDFWMLACFPTGRF